ncbi:hypothetical protein [Mycolicibacterium frederiksbergense]|uniref:hypothetical protein n=1 Tax=Mycolicibacterium frederiksbergense TaxID=117567 RepID=UPI00399A4EBA
MDTNTFDQLDPIQKQIAGKESESIMARWEFGHVLIKKRKGKQLPNGLRQKVADHFGLEASEITRRMQLADKFATSDEVEAACKRHGGSWRKIIADELIKRCDDQPMPNPWVDRAKGRLDKLVTEASDGHKAELMALLQDTLKSLQASNVDVAVAA